MLGLKCGPVYLALGMLALFCVPAAAQEHRHSAPPRGLFAERFDRLRRSLSREPEPVAAPRHVHPGHPKKADAAPPRLTNQSAKPAKSETATEAKLPSVKSSSVRPSSSRRTATRSQPAADESSSTEEPTLADEPEVAMAPIRSEDAEPEFDEPTVAPAATKPRAKVIKAEKQHLVQSDGESKSLFTRSTPKVTIHGSGPRRLAVGQAAEYKLTVNNEGDQPANDLVVMISLPDSAELSSTRPSTGTIDRSPSGSALQWAIRSLSAGKHEELVLRIVPHDSVAMALDVRCGFAAISAKTTLDVQEAKLALKIDGAEEVFCGEKAIYRLVITNPGNGAAENAVIHLMPLPPDEGAPATHLIGTLAPGESKVVEIELVARQGGRLTIQARATADGGLAVAASEEVAVHQAAVQVEVVGPPRQYAGAPATYRIHVRNPGDAPARRVKITAMLPGGSECLVASHDGKIDSKQGQASWSLSSLAAGAEQLFTVKCLVKSPGENRLEAVIEADGDLKHSNLATTDVVAVADLVLDIADPSGAVPVGQDSVYEVRIRNRGAQAAEGVEVTAFFSKGVEPFAADGSAHAVKSGTVVFETLASLAPGKEKVLKIHAKAAAAGTHRVRVELQCKSLGTKLTEEETTLYYADLPAERSSEQEMIADEPPAETPHIATPKRRELR
jgi:uncharacterized repeat protein (TIGR01451 family)